MNIEELLNLTTHALENIRHKLEKIPGLFLAATCARRPGFSSTITSAKIYAEMTYVHQDYDDIVTEFVYNVVDKIKTNLQDDGVCFVAIPPGELKVKLTGGNEGGPIVLDGSNKNYVFTYAIIR